ncbi:MAG: dihydroorotase [Sediminibacterium sp.]|nr:dihydroorotase [Sediminibacterium sp.]
MTTYLIKNIEIINDGKSVFNDVMIKNGRFEKIAPQINIKESYVEINGDGLKLLPGVIDDQVHFREPGLTHKACIETESKAAVAGGVTSFMEMPNTKPAATSLTLLEEKFQIAAKNSWTNYSFFLGASNDNLEEIKRAEQYCKNICGIKIFMGSSTGNLLVDNFVSLEQIFASSPLLIATHCEYEPLIQTHLEKYAKTLKDIHYHPIIRDEEVCYQSSLRAIQLAQKTGARLHILHISTAKELSLFSNLKPLAEKQITAEVCVHHLHFTSADYGRLGNLIKCNPAIKNSLHKTALWQALLNGTLDVVATDHAPHTWEEKMQDYNQAPAGVPLVQHSLVLMLKYVEQGIITIEQMVEKMCHNPAICFKVKERGFIREGYWADAVIIKREPWVVLPENIYYKCGWSPFLNETFPYKVWSCFVNGSLQYNQGKFYQNHSGQRLEFER